MTYKLMDLDHLSKLMKMLKKEVENMAKEYVLLYPVHWRLKFNTACDWIIRARMNSNV